MIIDDLMFRLCMKVLLLIYRLGVIVLVIVVEFWLMIESSWLMSVMGLLVEMIVF